MNDRICNYSLLLIADVNEERGSNPQHLIHLGLRYAEARVDYMGTCILMGNLSAFKTDLRDEWTLQETTSPSTGELYSFVRFVLYVTNKLFLLLTGLLRVSRSLVMKESELVTTWF